jgi:hypothetical protein
MKHFAVLLLGNMPEGARQIYPTSGLEKSNFTPEKAHIRAQKILEENEIKPEAFEGLYSSSGIKSDVNEVARLERKFDGDPMAKMYGNILEAITCEHGELSDWFGPNAQIIKTSRYDDYINKIDMVVETKSENESFSNLALGIDVTFGSYDLHKKFGDIQKKIDAGTLGEVKYFHSDRQHIHGRLQKVPQVVVGVEIDRVKELGQLWMQQEKKKLAIHPVQVTLLKEAREQLEVFASYAERTNKPDLAALFRRELHKVKEILVMKAKADLKGIPEDRVFEEIRRNLLFFK